MEEYLNLCVVFFFNPLWGMTKIETPVGLTFSEWFLQVADVLICSNIISQS
jgi:hypothetical protein